MIRLTAAGALIDSCEPSCDIREQFETRHCVRLAGLLDIGLLDMISQRIEQSEFHPRPHGDIALELCMVDNVALDVLSFMANAPTFLDMIRNLSGCQTIGFFAGRVYRIIPGAGHYDHWHDDAGDGRLIGMSVNLSAALYAGGVFQLRDRASQRILHEEHNTGFGDAIVFRLRNDLEHRVSDIQGSVAKTAFAGWFMPGPTLHSQMLEQNPA